MSTNAPNNQSSPKSKRSIWPWLALLVLTLMVIYAHQQVMDMIADFELLGRDFIQLGKWLGSYLPD